jgi:hypothetical protein
VISESGTYSLTQLFETIRIDHKFARSRCSAHPDAGDDYLDLPGRIIVHPCNQCKIALDRRILGPQVDLPCPAARVFGVCYPILLLICASELIPQVGERSQGPLIIQPADKYGRPLLQIIKCGRFNQTQFLFATTRGDPAKILVVASTSEKETFSPFFS